MEAVPAIDGEVPELGQVFDRLRAFAEERNRGLFAGLSGGTLREQSDGWLRISLPEGIAASRIQARKADLEAICSQFFSRPTEVEFEIESAGGIVRESNGEAVGEHQRESRKAALRHEAINEALEIFQAEIVEIRPLGDPVPGALLDVSDATPLEEA